MNKENKKMAQERRAQERARAQQAAKWKTILPTLIGVVVIAIAAVAVLTQGRQKENAAPETEISAAAASSAGAEKASGSSADASGQTESADGNGSYTVFDASSLKGCYDISSDELTYVQIKVRDYGTITAALDETIAPEDSMTV